MTSEQSEQKIETDQEIISRSVSPFMAAVKCVCPVCGKGKLFTGGLLVPGKQCDHCGEDFTKIDSGDGPAIFVMFILGFVLTILALILHLLFEPPLWVHTIIWTLGTVAGTIYLVRAMKALMIALQFKYKAEEAKLEDKQTND
jgi:uncharacterized protein (DUF983 family)